MGMESTLATPATDMHGLKMGPDGRIYFSIGDRGLHVKTEGRVVSNPHSGAVLRCNPDGSELELVATGLRNPQELVFDPYGNLFTGDNNADGGDKARWVHVIEGGDSGWSLGYQEMKQPTRLGPWNAEKIWNTQFDGQHANIVPPVAYLGNGPSGVTIHPGVAQIPDRYKKPLLHVRFSAASRATAASSLSSSSPKAPRSSSTACPSSSPGPRWPPIAISGLTVLSTSATGCPPLK